MVVLVNYTVFLAGSKVSMLIAHTILADQLCDLTYHLRLQIERLPFHILIHQALVYELLRIGGAL